MSFKTFACCGIDLVTTCDYIILNIPPLFSWRILKKTLFHGFRNKNCCLYMSVSRLTGSSDDGLRGWCFIDDELATELYFVQFGLNVNYARANKSGLSFLTRMITHHNGHRIVFHY